MLNKEAGTRNKEQRTKNKEQRTKNKEQRTKNKEYNIFYHISLGSKYFNMYYIDNKH